MRLAFVVSFCFLALVARAQEQERKLVDRLLEPNTTLENPAQHKQFNGAGAVTAKSASTRAFYVSNHDLAKTFAGTREFSTRSYSSRPFATKGATLPAAPRTKTFATQDARGVSSARDAGKSYDTRKYAGTRPFAGRGKSQEALHQQDRPLSIDDVRELLNKNK
ncbi:MAG: hypothetical protein DLM52_11010 [Chthoniobacterales bacterium]|nr:MAG: hypothetical protein DLM52_11010 [Chthoniobacterales bacterium]